MPCRGDGSAERGASLGLHGNLFLESGQGPRLQSALALGILGRGRRGFALAKSAGMGGLGRGPAPPAAERVLN